MNVHISLKSSSMTQGAFFFSRVQQKVDAEWFEKQPERLLEVDVHSNFRVNSIAFDVYKFSGWYSFEQQKLSPLFFKDNKWIGSTPKQVFDLGVGFS